MTTQDKIKMLFVPGTKLRRLNKKQKLQLLIDADVYITCNSGEVWGQNKLAPSRAERMIKYGKFEVKNGLLTWNDSTSEAWYVFTDTSLAALIA